MSRSGQVHAREMSLPLMAQVLGKVQRIVLDRESRCPCRRIIKLGGQLSILMLALYRTSGRAATYE